VARGRLQEMSTASDTPYCGLPHDGTIQLEGSWFGRAATLSRGCSQAIGAVFITASLAGCQLTLPDISAPFSDTTPTSQATRSADVQPKGAGSDQDGVSETPRFTQFTDIPIPANAEVDLDNLLVLGTEDGWIGRLALTSGHGMIDMYAFYEREMPRFGWDQITIIRSSISTMTYSRGPRIATITLHPKTTGGSNINFTVAPGADARANSGERRTARPGTVLPTRSRTQPRAQVGTNG
jgi:hypothetical protein